MYKYYTFFLRRLPILFIVLGDFFSGISQELGGRVLNTDRLPVVGATVRAYPGENFTITDEQGFFLIRGNSNASFLSIAVSHVAYTPITIEFSDSLSSPLEVVMTDAVTDLDEVLVVQSRILQKAIENSQSVIYIDQDFISRNGTGTFSGALAALPGVNTMNVGVGIAKPMIRGMGFNRILVNNRGIKQEGQQWGADHGLEIDPFDVEQVEIIKGPASLLFGSDGLGGVINIKENDALPKNGNVIHISSSYQTNNGAVSNSVAYKGRQDNWFYNVRATHQDYGDYTVPSDEFIYAGFNLPIFDNRLKNTAGEELHFSGTLGYRSEKLNSSLRVSSFNQKAGIFTGAIGLPRAYNLQHNNDFRNIDVPRQENHHHTITSNTTIALGSNRLEMDFGYQRNIREELSFPGAHGIAPELAGSNLALGLYLDTYTANVRYEINPNENHQVLFGGQFQYMQNQKDGFEFLLPVFNSVQTGLFHYQSFSLAPKWNMNAGVRYDLGSHSIERHLQPVYDSGTLLPTGEFDERTPAFDRSFDNFSGAAGITFKANYQNHLKLNLGNSFRFPTAIELSSNGVHHGNFRHELGNANLGVERGYQADFTYLHQSKRFFFEVSAFYGYYTDYIYLAPTGSFSPLASGGTLWEYRQDDALFNGFELTARYEFPFGLKTNLAADFVQNLNLNSRLSLPLTPPPSVTGSLEYAVLPNSNVLENSYVFISGRYNFEQNRTDRNEKTTPDSFLLDAGLGFHINLFEKEIQFRLSANNLLNTAYFNHISRYRLLNLPEQGRNIMLSVQLPINF